MKKTTAFLLALMLALPAMLPAAAEESTTAYVISTYGMIISLPSDMIVITTDNMDEFDYSTVNFTREYLYESFESKQVCLLALSSDNTFEVNALCLDSGGKDLADYSEKEIQNTVFALLDSYASTGLEILDQKTYTNQMTKYLKFVSDSSQGTGKSQYSMQYITIFDGYTVIVTYVSYGHEIGANDTSVMNAVIDSLAFKDR